MIFFFWVSIKFCTYDLRLISYIFWTFHWKKNCNLQSVNNNHFFEQNKKHWIHCTQILISSCVSLYYLFLVMSSFRNLNKEILFLISVNKDTKLILKNRNIELVISSFKKMIIHMSNDKNIHHQYENIWNTLLYDLRHWFLQLNCFLRWKKQFENLNYYHIL